MEGFNPRRELAKFAKVNPALHAFENPRNPALITEPLQGCSQDADTARLLAIRTNIQALLISMNPALQPRQGLPQA